MSDLARMIADLPYPVVTREDITTDGGACYVASNPDLPGCMSHGASIAEAIANLAEARMLYVESMLESNVYPSPPSASVVEQSGGSPSLHVVWRVRRTDSGGVAARTVESGVRTQLMPA